MPPLISWSCGRSHYLNRIIESCLCCRCKVSCSLVAVCVCVTVLSWSYELAQVRSRSWKHFMFCCENRSSKHISIHSCIFDSSWVGKAMMCALLFRLPKALQFLGLFCKKVYWKGNDCPIYIELMIASNSKRKL